jgi:hypothetical protein
MRDDAGAAGPDDHGDAPETSDETVDGERMPEPDDVAPDAETGPVDELTDGFVVAPADTSDEIDGTTPADDPPLDDESAWGERILTGAIVTGCCLFVFWQLQPGLIFTDSTPTGGDMGAHVWGPAFLRDELLPRLRLTGWTPDWYSGFPAFHFYMVIPALAIVMLDVGLHPVLATVVVVALAGLVGRFWTADHLRRFAPLVTGAAAIAAILAVSIPYNVAFKLVAVSGVVLFPAGAWALGHFAGLRAPGPALLSIASLGFAFDRSFNIYGGNIASTLAGEFAASISLTLSLVALGLIIRGTRTGEYKVRAALAIALTGLCHLLPAFFLLAAVVVLMLGRLAQTIRAAVTGGDWRTHYAALPWMLSSGILAALVSAFWVFPFWARTDFLNDMGWERIEIIHSPLVTRSRLNPADVLSDYPPLPVLLVLAVIGVVLSIRHRVMLGWVLTGTGAVMALGFVYFPDGRLWNARILPFYYLCVTLLAGLGIALTVRSLARASQMMRQSLLSFGIVALAIPGVRAGTVWPEPGDEGSYLADAGAYSLRVLALAALLLFAFTELPRQLSRVVRRGHMIAALIAVGLMAASPARDVRIDGFRNLDGNITFSSFFFSSTFLWALVLFGSIVAVVLFVERTVRSLRRRVAAEQPLLGAPDLAAARWAAPVGAFFTVFVLLGLALNAVGGIEQTDEGRSWSLAGLDITSDDVSFIPGWATWNFSGLEAKTRNDGATGDVGKGGWLEYQYVQRTMLGVGERVGCGRAMWEFAPELNRYGTTMAMMLLPMWTDGCIGSMEGLYFEATPTVPYHFLLQSDLSAPSRSVGDGGSVGGPSRAMRDLPYENFDIDRGVDRLLELGVRYYLAFSPQTISAARAHPGLTEVTSASPWVVFSVESTLVEPLDQVPVVVDGVRDHQDQWLDVGVEWFTTAANGVRPASSGPEEWPSVDAEELVARYEAEGTRLAGSIPAEAPTMADLLPVEPVTTAVTVSSVVAGTDRIRFSVDQIGHPVLVRTSYFPNWSADGADGPYRVAPNFMVVVPTENDVELTFGRTGVDWLALLFTATGAAGVVLWGTRRRDDGEDNGPEPLDEPDARTALDDTSEEAVDTENVDDPLDEAEADAESQPEVQPVPAP